MAVREINPYQFRMEHPQPESCCDQIVDIAVRTAKAVYEFFAEIAIAIYEAVKSFFEFLFDDGHVDQPVEIPGGNQMIEDIYQYANNPNLVDIPINLENLKAALRRNENPQISRQMTSANFSELCEAFPIRVLFLRDGVVFREAEVQAIHEVKPMLEVLKQEVRQQHGDAAANQISTTVRFPPQRQQIGQWAATLARQKTVRMDPAHPYAPIFQALKTFKNDLSDPGDQEDFTLDPDHIHDQGVSEYKHIYQLLLNFQELSRPEHIRLMRLLDNNTHNWASNQAYNFARSCGKINAYPIPDDTPDKLFDGIGLPMLLFTQVQELLPNHPELMRTFFAANGAFKPQDICFDARVTRMEEFRGRLTIDPDFAIALPNFPNNHDRAFAYFKMFENKQILKFVAENAFDMRPLTEANLNPMLVQHRVAYDQFKAKLGRWRNEIIDADHEIEQFMNGFLTKPRFVQTLHDEHLHLAQLTWDPIIGDYFNLVPPEED